MSVKWGHGGSDTDLARLAERAGGWLGLQGHDPQNDPDPQECTCPGPRPACPWCPEREVEEVRRAA